jgi:soluble lytic murein transglycosylase-like protein
LSIRKSNFLSQTCTAILFVLLPLQWSISTSGKVSHPGDLDLLTSAAQPAPAPAPAPSVAAASPAPAKTKVGEKAFSRLPFAKEISLAAKNNGIDALLLTAVVKTESRFDPSAISPRGAVGLMQVRPDQAEQEDPQLLLDPAHNLQRGASYLRSMLDQFGGDLRLALAAYNAGPSAVRRFGGAPPYAETEAFVARVLSSYVELHGSYEAAGQAGS